MPDDLHIAGTVSVVRDNSFPSTRLEVSVLRVKHLVSHSANTRLFRHQSSHESVFNLHKGYRCAYVVEHVKAVSGDEITSSEHIVRKSLFGVLTFRYIPLYDWSSNYGTVLRQKSPDGAVCHRPTSKSPDG